MADDWINKISEATDLQMDILLHVWAHVKRDDCKRCAEISARREAFRKRYGGEADG